MVDFKVAFAFSALDLMKIGTWCHISNARILILLGSASLIFGLCAPSSGSDIINISKAAPIDAKQAITLEGPQLKTRVTIQNLTDKPKPVVLVSAPFVELDGKATAPATWTFMLGNELVTITDSPVAKILQPKTEYPVTLSASFDVAGNYRALLTASEDEKEGQVFSRFAVDVIFPPQTLIPNSLAGSSATYLNECEVMSNILCWNEPIHISTYLQNVSSKTLMIKKIEVSQLLVKKNGQDIAISNPKAKVTTCDNNNALISLPLSAICNVDLELEVPGAGDYIVKLNTTGVAGGAVDNTVSLKVRDSVTICAIFLFIGAVIGAFVHEWRGQTRTSLVAIFDITRTSELLRPIKVVDPGAQGVLRAILAYGNWLRGEYLSAVQKDSEPAVSFRARGLAFVKWSEYETAFIGLTSDEQEKVRAARNESLQLLSDINADMSKLNGSLNSFKKDLEESHKRVPPPRLNFVGAQKSAGTSAGTSLLDTSSITSFLLGLVKRDKDSKGILAAIKKGDYLVNFIGLLLVLFVGIQALWLPSLTWGSGSDYLTAFFAAAGLQFGYGAAISELRTGFSTGIK